MSVILVEILVRIERSHAPGTCRGDGLTIHMIRDIASGKYPRNAGRRRRAIRAALDDDVAFAHVELPGEDAGIRRMPDGDEGAGDVQGFDGSAVVGRLDLHAV